MAYLHNENLGDRCCYRHILFPYFSSFFLCLSMHLCPILDFHFLHAAIILLHRHFFISPFTWLIGMPSWFRPLVQLLLSHIHLHPVQGYAFHFCFFSSMLWLYHSILKSLHASILKAVCLTSLISDYDLPPLLWVQDIDLYNTYW